MYIINKTEIFDQWFSNLRDINGKARILARLKRVELGNLGDHKAVGNGVSELKVDCGPGYRIYFAKKDKVIILLLNGGDKSTQAKDIKIAYQMLKKLGEKDGK
jgi:putative addiction module killer protein